MGFDPASAAGLAVVSTGLNIMGDIEKADAAKHVAAYKAQVAANNAQYASQVGQADAGNESLKNAVKLGSIKTSQAANGVNVNTGSALKIQQGAREAGTVDVQNIENNALLQAYGYQSESELHTAEKQQAGKAEFYDITGDLLSGASSLSGGKFKTMMGG